MFKSSLKAGLRNVKVNFPGCPLYLHQSVGQQHDGSKIQREQVCATPQKQMLCPGKISTKCPSFEVEVGTYFRTITDLEMVGDNITGLEDDNNRCSH